MLLLIVAIVLFLGLHAVPTRPDLRAGLMESLGATGYRIFFSVGSTLTLILLIYAFTRSPFIPLWMPPAFLRWVAVVLMLPAFIFLVAAYFPGEIKRRLKFPFLVAVKTWALAHLLANGDIASILLFGSMLAYAVYDRISLKDRQPTTSLIGFAGEGGPRNDLIAVVGGAILYLLFLFWLHRVLIGVSPIPH